MIRASLRRSLVARAPRRVRRARAAAAGRAALSALGSAAAGPRPLVAGPWLSEVGFELLYWLPLLTWARDELRVRPEDVIAVSRGGAGCWYGGVAARTFELFDLIEPDELRAWQRTRRELTGSEKQGTVPPRDREILGRLGLGLKSWLHPSVMYRLFEPAWTWSGELDAVLERCRFEPLPPSESTLAPDALPPSFVALKPYFSLCFPDTAENRAFLENLVRALTVRRPVVLLRTAEQIDDHVAYLADLENVIDAAPLLGLRDNLAVQTEIVRLADALVSTYGGFSYLGPYLGTLTRSFFSAPTFNPFHVAVYERALEALHADSAALPKHVRQFEPPV